MMTQQAVRAHLGAHKWRDLTQVLPQVDSTNTLCKALAAQGAPEGTVVIADSQTGGRGRLGRSFSSPAGQGIYFSVILRPECPPTELTHLTAVEVFYINCRFFENFYKLRRNLFHSLFIFFLGYKQAFGCSAIKLVGIFKKCFVAVFANIFNNFRNDFLD